MEESTKSARIGVSVCVGFLVVGGILGVVAHACWRAVGRYTFISPDVGSDGMAQVLWVGDTETGRIRLYQLRYNSSTREWTPAECDEPTPRQ